MLEKLLSEIRSGGTFEIGVLAVKLETTPELVEVMLEHLQNTGYIHPYQTCSNACSRCNLKNACKTTHQTDGVRLWQG